VDSLTWWFGEEVVRVFAHLRATVPLRPAEGGGVERVSADDSYTLHLEFASGATATVCMDVSGAAFGDRWEVVGESGALQMEADARLSRVGPDGGAAEAIPLETLAPPALPAGLEAGRLTAPFLRLLDRFAARLDGDAEAARDLPDLAQGLRVQRVLDAARLSSATGAFVRVLP
jgi:predicted dehydrogenase